MVSSTSSKSHNRRASKASCSKPNEKVLATFLEGEYEKKSSEICYKEASAEWEHLVDMDDEEKANASINTTLETAKLQKQYWQKYFRKFNPSRTKNPKLRRQICLLRVLGNSALDDEKLEKLTKITNSMTKIYSSAKICPYENQNCMVTDEGLSLDPDIFSALANSDDYEKLLYIWRAWRTATGAKVKDYFYDYVKLSNAAAVANNFTDKGAMWRHEFESPSFEKDLEMLWAEVRPLYNELHQYVLNKLKIKYRDYIHEEEIYIPAHILGNVWAQNWVDVAPFVLPHPEETTVNYTGLLREHNFTVLKMYETANDFYLSLGLESNDMCYNVSAGALIEKPDDRNVLCHASAWDFSNGKDYRIKMCTEVNFEDFVIIHHEMGHIQYYQLYKHQPHTFRSGANPGFHEAIGDTIALSVTTPQHLYKIGLLEDFIDSEGANLNALMTMALARVAFLPYGYLLDKWRWDVFSGKIAVTEWNSQYWKYREAVQKVKPPIPRSDEEDFDPGAKFHVVADAQYISYFVAHILQFQMHRALCITAGQYKPGDDKKPLHKCDIYGSKAAGHKLRCGLSLGSSVHWSVVLHEITGESKLSGSAIMEYFDPLMKYLKTVNDRYADRQK